MNPQREAPRPITSIPEGNSTGHAQKTGFLVFPVTKQGLFCFCKDVIEEITKGQEKI